MPIRLPVNLQIQGKSNVKKAESEDLAATFFGRMQSNI